ncbi:hypothetical protein COOONC_22551 [Cooperia oncophora]
MLSSKKTREGILQTTFPWIHPPKKQGFQEPALSLSGGQIDCIPYREEVAKIKDVTNLALSYPVDARQQQRLKRAGFRTLTRAERENSDMCRFLLRMGRSA